VGGRNSSGGNSKAKKIGFTNDTLDYHFNKHAKDFNVKNKSEYERLAKQFRDSKLTKDMEEFVGNNGRVYRYNHKTNEFLARENNGEVVTYFLPSGESRYWYVQNRRYGGPYGG
jgi:pyocin large subunit-like protein